MKETNEYLTQFMQILRKIENLDLFAATAKFSKTEFRILREIVTENERGNQIISSELARRIGVTRSAVSQIVNKMEKEGVIKRAFSPDNKKIAYVQLSERTRGVYEEQCKQANEYISKIISAYGKEKWESFLSECRELSEVYENLKRETIERSGQSKNK